MRRRIISIIIFCCIILLAAIVDNRYWTATSGKTKNKTIGSFEYVQDGKIINIPGKVKTKLEDTSLTEVKWKKVYSFSQKQEIQGYKWLFVL